MVLVLRRLVNGMVPLETRRTWLAASAYAGFLRPLATRDQCHRPDSKTVDKSENRARCCQVIWSPSRFFKPHACNRTARPDRGTIPLKGSAHSGIVITEIIDIPSSHLLYLQPPLGPTDSPTRAEWYGSRQPTAKPVDWTIRWQQSDPSQATTRIATCRLRSGGKNGVLAAGWVMQTLANGTAGR